MIHHYKAGYLLLPTVLQEWRDGGRTVLRGERRSEEEVVRAGVA